MGPLTPHCSPCLGKAAWSFSSRQQSTAAPWNPAWLWECPSQWCHCQGEGLGSPRGQTNHRDQPHKGRQAPYLGPLVPRHGSPQAGRQERTKCESALRPGPTKGQMSGRRSKIYISPPQNPFFFLSSLKASQALGIIDGTERVGGEEHTGFPVTATYYFIFFGLSNIAIQC